MRRRSKANAIKSIAAAGGIGAAAGFVAGILSAPKSGKQTRKDLKDAGDKSVADAEKELKNLHTELTKLIKDASLKKDKLNSKTKTDAKKWLDKSVDTKEKVKEIISAIHEGDAEDHDLKTAVKNANNAIEHLKDYLKK